jgi:hypothetical protein
MKFFVLKAIPVDLEAVAGEIECLDSRKRFWECWLLALAMICVAKRCRELKREAHQAGYDFWIRSASAD